jgi:S-adenosylmethionine synthetase
MVRRYIFTSESVTEGHPDKICDQVSDSILDEFLASDSESRVAVESLKSKGVFFVAGVVKTKPTGDIKKVVLKVIS